MWALVRLLNVHYHMCIKITRSIEMHEDSVCTWICWFNSQSCISSCTLGALQMSILIICLKRYQLVLCPVLKLTITHRGRDVFSEHCHPIEFANRQERVKLRTSYLLPHILHSLQLKHLGRAQQWNLSLPSRWDQQDTFIGNLKHGQLR